MDEERLSDYWNSVINEVESSADTANAYAKFCFLENTKHLLIEANFFTDINEEFFEAERGDRRFKPMHIDAGAVEPTDDSIHLMYIDYDRSEISSITNEKVNKAYESLINFLTNVKNDYFRINCQQSNPIFPFVKDVIKTLKTCDNIHLYFLSTNRRSRVLKPSNLEDFDAGGRKIPVTTHLLDIEYLYNNELSGQPNEPIEIDISDYVPDGIECLRTKLKDVDYDAYLAVLPGNFLADIYKKYGGRLLESNVRSFLSTRGGVNKGIRATIRDNPTLFFTYNNGIACTADDVDTELRGGALYLTKIKNFQIINGGQTTASLRNSQIVDKVSLDDIFVSMKLTVIHKEVDDFKRGAMVQNISKYSNTQNKVTSSDMNSNSALYVRLEQISRKIMAPLVGNNTYQTFWYFERSRGQYERDQMELTPSKRKEFVKVHPKNQRIRIIDIAKYYNSVEELPFYVVWGGQVNAEKFQNKIQEKWEDDPSQFNELFFKRLIGKAILFKRTHDLIIATDWYKANSGILAELVPYTISKLCHQVKELGKTINWLDIWNKQCLPKGFDEEILKLGRWVFDRLSDPNREKPNIAEWAKVQRCWTGMAKLEYNLSDDVVSALATKEDEKIDDVSAKKQQRAETAVDDGLIIFKLGVNYWTKVRDEGQREGALNGYDLIDIQSALQSCQKGYLLPAPVVKRVMAIRQRLENLGLDVATDLIRK